MDWGAFHARVYPSLREFIRVIDERIRKSFVYLTIFKQRGGIVKSIKNFMILSLSLGMISASVNCAAPVLEDGLDIKSEQATVLEVSAQLEEHINFLTASFEQKRINKTKAQEKIIRRTLFEVFSGFIESNIESNKEYFTFTKIDDLLRGVSIICSLDGYNKDVRESKALEDGIAPHLVRVREKHGASFESMLKKMLEFVWRFFTPQEMDFVKKQLEILAEDSFSREIQKTGLTEQKTSSQASPKRQKISLVRQVSSSSSASPCSPLASPGVSRTLSSLSLVSRMPGSVQRLTSGPASPATLQLGAAPFLTRSTSSLGSTESSPIVPIYPLISPPSADEPSPTVAQESSPTGSVTFSPLEPLGDARGFYSDSSPDSSSDMNLKLLPDPDMNLES